MFQENARNSSAGVTHQALVFGSHLLSHRKAGDTDHDMMLTLPMLHCSKGQELLSVRIIINCTADPDATKKQSISHDSKTSYLISHDSNTS